ncbi:protein regulator of cytokinesis 1-like [Chelonus insularis]|uniref:protein regulator of cytokinesis 1-like n=1 Tax=Chelonus insularis TaxID=460826 RepID=UPI00158BEFC3|nr:protein regulator of cytokinesis 1-like [Chelonus insularis]
MGENWTEEQLLNIISLEVKKTTRNLFSIWQQVGFEEEVTNKYKKDIYKHIQELLNDMEIEAEENKNNYLKNIDKMVQLVHTLSNELRIEISMPKYQAESLLNATIVLKKKIRELEILKEHRMSEVQVLLDKERQICKHLGLQPNGFKFSVPNSDEIKDFESNLMTLETELSTRKTNFIHLRQSIVEMMEEMALSPTNNFERLIWHDSHDFIYSSINMAKLEKLHDEIQERLATMKEKAENKRQELLKLLKYLDVPKDKYENILTKYSGFDTITINALDKELRKYMKKKEENMSTFIRKIREELEHWWNICKLSPQEREQFRFYTSEIYNEDTLKLHELEVEKLKWFYESNQKLFELLDKRDEMWEQNKEYRRQIENPSRYHNRGGQLLAEEKARKYLAKNLPKVEEQLKEMVIEYENTQGKPFTIYGLQLTEYFSKQIKDLETEMEELKAAKLKAKDERSAKKTPLSASRRNLAYASIRGTNTSLKRKDRSPLAGVAKSARLANSENIYPKVVSSKIRRSGRLKVARKLLSSSKNSPRTPKTPSVSKNKTEIGDTNSSNNTTKVFQQYEEFQEHLANKDELRSTLIIDLNETVKTKKPLKTPVKPSRKHCSPRTPLRKSKLTCANQMKSPRYLSTPKLVAAPNPTNENVF